MHPLSALPQVVYVSRKHLAFAATTQRTHPLIARRWWLVGLVFTGSAGQDGGLAVTPALSAEEADRNARVTVLPEKGVVHALNAAACESAFQQPASRC